MTEPKAYIFDVFGTLVDWRSSVARFVEPHLRARKLDIDPHAFADAWRGEYQGAMERVRSGSRGYVPLDDLHLENLGIVLEKYEISDAFDVAEKIELNKAWEHLDPWEDAVPGLEQLKQRAFIAPCSNGSIAMMTHLARHAGFPWDCILGADIAGNYKPRPEVYRACCSALRLPVEEVMMVAAHNDDLAAARDAGLPTAFIPRPLEQGPDGKKDVEPAQDWERVIEDLRDL